jgi:sulfite reductase beta subunit-like hemoprotein
MGLNRAVKERLQSMEIDDELTKQIHVKMSGCPNGCSQHHIANIGFYGASLRVGDRHIPAYIPHIAGNYVGGEIVFGKRLKARLPAKRVPDAVERWVRLYESERADGEEFNAFAERIETKRFEEEIKDLTMPIEFTPENVEHFVDWSRSEPYRVERGEGECAI